MYEERLRKNKYAKALFISLMCLIIVFIIGAIITLINLEPSLDAQREKYISMGYDSYAIDEAISMARALIIIVFIVSSCFILVTFCLGLAASLTGRCRIGTIVLSSILVADEGVSALSYLVKQNVIGFLFALLYLLIAIFILIFAKLATTDIELPNATIDSSEIDAYAANKMDTLYEIDLKDYDSEAPVVNKVFVKAIVIENNKIGILHSTNYDFYHLPTKAVNDLRDNKKLAIESITQEGLEVINNSLRNYGRVIKKQKGKNFELVITTYYYYFLNVKNTYIGIRHYIDNDNKFVWVSAEEIIDTNFNKDHGEKNIVKKNIELEAEIFKKLKEDSFIF